MSYSERSYAGPDIAGRVFAAEPTAHCAARDEFDRLRRIDARMADRRRGRRLAR